MSPTEIAPMTIMLIMRSVTKKRPPVTGVRGDLGGVKRVDVPYSLSADLDVPRQRQTKAVKGDNMEDVLYSR